MIDVTFLGTTSSIPTKNRGHPGIHVKCLDNNLIFDCGEGTQRQLAKAGISPYKITAIFISHLHGDHILGLGGLIQSQAFLGRERELDIYGPKGIREQVDFFKKWGDIECPFPINAIELSEGIVYENSDLIVRAFPVEHTCPTFGFTFEEKVEVNLNVAKLKKLGLYNNPLCKKLKDDGHVKWDGKEIRLEDVSKPLRHATKITIVTDSKPTDKIVEYARGSDLFVCESTYGDELQKKAEEYGHMTSTEAAYLALNAGVKKLALTHFSARYDDEKVLEKEAKAVFKNTVAAHDLLQIEL